MSYVKQTWINGVSKVNAERMNYIEEGIYQNSKITNAITISTSDTVNLNAGDKIPFSIISNINGNKLSLVSNGVKIGTGITKVCVSAQLQYYSRNTTRQWFTLYKNNQIINQSLEYSNTYNVQTFSPKIIDVSEGDVISCYLSNVEGTGEINLSFGISPHDISFLTVQEIR